jgi:hypothetical protein
MFEKIKAAWRYSRTVFLNALCGLMVVFGELLQFAVGFDWSAVVSTRSAGLIVLGVNVTNIVLRHMTTKPVGEK